MEKVVRVKAQSPLKVNNWTSPSGETKIIKIVELQLTDGVDTFVAEANDDLAEQLNNEPLKAEYFYGLQARMIVIEWKKQDGSQARATRIRIQKIVAF